MTHTWQPIETAPKNTYVDLWVVGGGREVYFYCPDAAKVKGTPLCHGRATHYKWLDSDAPPGWYSNHGLGGALVCVEPTHWMPIPTCPL